MQSLHQPAIRATALGCVARGTGSQVNRQRVMRTWLQRYTMLTLEQQLD
jgi:hypothetical protein